jgi:cytochrome c biogenesis protein CcdA
MALIMDNISLALLSAAVLGFRHGLDYDHVAAISDISSVQSSARDAMRYGLLYVSGHATTVAVLGVAAIAFRLSLPPSSDRWAERLVGGTLVVLGIYVLGTFLRRSQHSHFRPRTRITLLINAVLWMYWRLSRVFGGGRGAQAPEAFAQGYGNSSTFLVGVIHGLGAETPTQLALFFMAAKLGGTAAGLLGLAMFIAGLLVMNTLMCASAAGLFTVVFTGPRAMQTITLFTAAYSIAVGAIFLLGSAGRLPSLNG